MKGLRAIALAAALLGSACRAPPPPDPLTLPAVELVPRQEGAPALAITVAEYRARAARLRQQLAESVATKALPDALQAHVIDSLIEERLLLHEAERLSVRASTTAVAKEIAHIRGAHEAGEFERGLAKSYQTEADLARAIETRLVIQGLLEKQAFADLKASDDALRAAYDAMPAQAKEAPARVRAAQIVLGTEEEATRVHATLTRGADFATLARTLSIAPEAPRGGELGWFAAGEMPAVFEQACAPLEVGQVSPPTASQFGYHICTVLERAPAHARTFDEMKAELRSAHLVAARREAHERYLDRLRGRYDIIRHAERMPLQDR